MITAGRSLAKASKGWVQGGEGMGGWVGCSGVGGGYLSAGAFILVITAMLQAVGAVLLLLFGRLHTHRQTTRVFFCRGSSLEFCKISTPKSV